MRSFFLYLFLVYLPIFGSTEDSILIEALRANPELEAAYQTYQAATRKAPQVRALDEPVVSYSEFLSSIQTRTGPQERIISVAQSFPWPGVLQLRADVADAKARMAYFQYEVKRREVIEKVGLAEIEYAYLHRAMDRARENLDLLRQLKPVVEEKVRAGASLSTSLRLDVEVAVADQEVASLREKRPGLDAQLKVLLGREPGDDFLPWPVLPSSLPAVMPLDRIRAEVKLHHPKIYLAAAGVEAARTQEVLADKSDKPNFTVGANAIDIGNGGDTAGSVMVGVEVPLRSRKYRAERDEAAAMTAAAGASLEAVEQSLLGEAVRFSAAQQEAIDRFRNYSENLIPAATQAVDLTKEDYRNDKASLTDLIESERVLLDLRLLRARALADAHQAAWRIRALTESLSLASK